MDIASFVTGPIQTNTYVLIEGDKAWIVDPGGDPNEPVDFLLRAEVEPSCMLLTHGHGDHLGGCKYVKAAFPNVELLCPAGDEMMLTDADANLSAPFGMTVTAYSADCVINPGDELALGETRWTVLDTSGHTPGGVSFYCRSVGAVIVGDALFAGSVGRTDIPGADTDQLIRNIRENLLTLPDETRVLPGHGPETTVGREKQSNPFLR